MSENGLHADDIDGKTSAQAALEAEVHQGRAPPPGSRWRHYRGGTYTVATCALDEATLVPVVVYRSEERGTVWVRTLAVWRERVALPHGAMAPRFAPIAPHPPNRARETQA
jgi:hypothetical protein